jgi:hypothetical protein
MINATSLLVQHQQQVDRHVARVLPARTEGHPTTHVDGEMRMIKLRRRRGRLARFRMGFMIGWPTWFSNRRTGIRNRWFALTTRAAYRNQPRV